jgi:ATP-dependent Clp protease ATP-binding subunit ClpC
MFERFTERARQVVVLAQEESRLLKHNYIGTEHILLGLLREEEGLAARVLHSFDITVEEVRAQVARFIGEGDEVTTGQIPFTPRAKKVLELALREALSLGHNYIGTEHVLLGIVRENSGVAARILLDFDADAETIRNEIIPMLSGPGGQQPGAGPGSDPSSWGPEEAERARARAEARIFAHDPSAATELRSRYRAQFRRRAGLGYARGRMQAVPFLPGWLLFGVSLGLGVLIGWAIWGL